MKYKGILNILHIYSKDMNIYGDYGNILAIKNRAKAHRYKVEVSTYNPGDQLKANIDILVGGGGQDTGQIAIHNDLMDRKKTFQSIVNDETPALVICGLYQLFGNEFLTISGQIMTGLEILNIKTKAINKRRTGNIVVKSEEFGNIIGYENHSGQTFFLNSNVKPLGVTNLGQGNNGKDRTEGVRYKNIIASYLHGPILPKNPNIADFLIQKACEKKFGNFIPEIIDETLIKETRRICMKLSR